MSDDSSFWRRHPFLIAGLAIVMAIGGWHYVSVRKLETRMQQAADEGLREILDGATATVRIQPLTNLISIEVQRPIHRDDPAAIIADLLWGFMVDELEPVVERELETAARADFDLYAMWLPYRAVIDINSDRAGLSGLVQDIQIELIRLGFDIGDADGVNGPRTKKAITQVQAQLKIERNGEASEELLNSLRAARPAAAE